MQIVRTKQRHSRTILAGGERPAHLQLRRERRERKLETGEIESRAIRPLQSPFNPHEEQAQFFVPMLVGVQNVGALFVQKRGDAGHQASPVRTVDQKHRGIAHSEKPKAWMRQLAKNGAIKKPGPV